jgi:hypothetical protein
LQTKRVNSDPTTAPPDLAPPQSADGAARSLGAQLVDLRTKLREFGLLISNGR